MKIRTLRMDFDSGIKTEVWADCFSEDDCDIIISWLQMAKRACERL